MEMLPNSPNKDKIHIPPGGAKPLCVVCEEFTDGQHFGQFTCRACAAFFRRTMAQNLRYVCKFDQNCEISKDVRNFCRYCRYHKCVAQGMIADAVQSHRDTYGKRNLPSLEDSPPKVSSTNEHQRQPRIHKESDPTYLSEIPSSSFTSHTHTTKAISFPQMSTTKTSSNAAPTTTTTSFTLFQENKTYPSLESMQIDHHSPSRHQQTSSHQKHNNHQQINFPLKRLTRMVEGYHKFRSLRKASYSLFMDEPRFMNSESIPESTYSNNKKSCQVESSLAYDMIMEYFDPYSNLPLDDRNKLFANFQGLLSCGEKGYNTCRAYGHMVENNDRLIMTDGGYIKLGELSKYYANSNEVNGNPDEVARFFSTSITYAVKIVIPAMIKADLDDYIIVAIYGLCLFQEGVEGISEETKKVAIEMKDEILKDLYLYYRSKGLDDAELNFKMSKALLLLPKYEHITRLVQENFRVADLFSLCEIPKAYK